MTPRGAISVVQALACTRSLPPSRARQQAVPQTNNPTVTLKSNLHTTIAHPQLRTAALLLSLASLHAAPPVHLDESAEVQAAIARISADSLKGNLSFLASDVLEGRSTGTRGNDIAAEFIASQFRRAGLEPAVNGSYFQPAEFSWIPASASDFKLTVENQGGTLSIDPAHAFIRSRLPVNLTAVPVFKYTGGDVPPEVAGKAVWVTRRPTAALVAMKPAVILTSAPVDDTRHPLLPAQASKGVDLPFVMLSPDVTRVFDTLPAGPATAVISLHAQPQPVQLRNVIGLLRGSDPALQDSYLLVTAHYDHIAMKTEGDGDRIYNGANDDGSGTVSVIELANALGAIRPHPKRSIVFIAWAGEEDGLVGSQYYGRHPVFPLDKTVAMINLEQIGRTDDSDGPEVKSATVTGFTYSTVPAVLGAAAKAVGMRLDDRNPGLDPYFDRSDNQALANLGIPSHTVVVALEFPDYHKVGDEWEKIDYANMTIINRMLGLGIVSLANDSEAPQWNESNHNTQKYRKAWQLLRSHPVP